MTTSTRVLIVVILALIAASCAKQQDQPKPSNSGNPTVVTKTQATGMIKASPNPIKVCDGTGTGITTITWSASGAARVEVRIGAPDGGLFAFTGPDGGTKETGRWVSNETTIYLQDVSEGRPLTSDNTIATVTATVTTEGCP